MLTNENKVEHYCLKNLNKKLTDVNIYLTETKQKFKEVEYVQRGTDWGLEKTK